jgi:hypothetical protein
MIVSTGYTLDQLLTWCRQDELIDYFEQVDDVVVIVRGGRRFAFQPEEAMVLLKELFTSRGGSFASTRNGLDALNRQSNSGAAS